MKRFLALILSGVLTLGLFGCAAAAEMPATSAAAPPSNAPISSTPPQDDSPEPAPQSLKILLPSSQESLADMLTQMAAKEGIGLQIETAVYGDRYAAAVEAAMNSTSPPDIIWLSKAADAQGIRAGTALLDLSGQDATPSMRALSAMVPAAARYADEDAVLGLPLGSSAEGYIVNLDLLCALLDTADVTALRADLMACSWQQWQTLAATVEAYLSSPQKTVVEIGYHSYTLPRGRPSIAQPLRGIFAVADADNEALVGNALEAAVTAAFSSEAELLAADVDTRTQRLRPALEAMLALVGLETRHMARSSGALSRGERYNMAAKVNQEDAVALFTDKTALFLRGSSQLVLGLEAENPALEGRLMLIPLKMPPVPDAETEDEADDSSAAASSSDASEAEEDEEAPTGQPALSLADEIAANNRTLLHSTGGVLCVSSKAPKAAQNLLLRLFTTDEGRAAITQEMQLWPFSSPAPTGSVHTQVANAVVSGAGRLVQWPTALAAAKESMGAAIMEGLMQQESWPEDLRADFVNTALGALGMPQRE